MFFYRHVHCPCLHCNGRAVDRKTELRHWNESKTLNATHVSSLGALRETLVSDNDHEESAIPDNEDTTDEGLDVHSESHQVADEPEPSTSPINEIHYDHLSNINVEDKEVHMNPLRKLVVNSILRALKIVKESGSSCKTFEDILDYGKTLLLTNYYESKNTEHDILLMLWPRNWNSVQKLLKEEGYDDAKLLYICMCSFEKEISRKGKTTTTISSVESIVLLKTRMTCVCIAENNHI